MAMYGLIDCNNFFVSCEQVFRPGLLGKPVIVLSNNDGCAVALSNEAKALGLKRGDAYFKIKQLCDRHGVAVFSGNHRLYGDMSARVMATLGSIFPTVDVYSIDEAFIDFSCFEPERILDVAHEAVRRVRRNTGIPTSLGIAPTRTLAKIASRFAKKYPGYRGACIIADDEARRKALSLTPVGDVWGVGRRLVRRFNDIGVATALQFADMTQEQVDCLFNVTGDRTWRELNGVSCITADEAPAPQKQMCCSRSFGTMLTTFDELRRAIAIFATIASRRLREQRLAAVSVSVFIHTNGFRDDLPQYCNSANIRLPEATADTMAISETAVQALRTVYREGYRYKKAGILISEVIPAEAVRQSIFTDPVQRRRRARLMHVVDEINSASIARDTVHIAAYEPVERIVRSEQRSRLYSTRLNDIIKVNCNDRLQ